MTKLVIHRLRVPSYSNSTSRIDSGTVSLSLFLFLSFSLSNICLRSAAGWLVDTALEAVEDRHVV